MENIYNRNDILDVIRLKLEKIIFKKIGNTLGISFIVIKNENKVFKPICLEFDDKLDLNLLKEQEGYIKDIEFALNM